MERLTSKMSMSRAFFICLVLLMGVLMIYDFITTKQTAEPNPRPRSDRTDFKLQSKKAEKKSSEEKDSFFLAMETKQSKRIQLFKQMCKSFGYNKKPLSWKAKLFRSRKYKVAWKNVPKIGSTFLIQVFRILNDETGEDVFSKARDSIHRSSNKKYYKLKEIQNNTVLTMARNPYSRLFSGYIDKVYLPNALHLSRKVYLRQATNTGGMVKSNVCMFNNTFDDFLSYVFDENIRQYDMYGHYGPVLSTKTLSTLCGLPNIVIVKQESFSEDVEYALQLAGVDKKKFDIIYAAMHKKNVQSTIPGIVKTVYGKMSLGRNSRLHDSKNCLSWSNIAERVWTSFQIQGYISEKSKFPHHKFSNKELYKDSKYLINLILNETKKHPLTHEQKVKQRTKALLKAYSTISNKTKLKIQQRFAQDFSFFDYSKDLQNVNK